LDGVESFLETLDQNISILESNSDADQIPVNAILGSPFQFVIMSQDSVRTGQGEVCAEGRAFVERQGVKECSGAVGRMEQDGE